MRIAVIGAGVLGASVAYHLARAGAQVVIFDAALDGIATAAGAGIICPWVSETGDEAFTTLYVGGARYYQDLVARLGNPSALGYRRSGALCVSDRSADLDAIESEARQWTRSAPEIGAIRRLTPADTQALFPPLAPNLAAVFIEGGARVDGRHLVAGILKAACHHGARLVTGEATPEFSAGRVSGVRAGHEVIPADIVVAANGAWANTILGEARVALPVSPQRGQILHLSLNGQDTSGWPVILPPGPHYMLAFDDSRVVAGATREHDAGFDYRVTASGLAELLREALKIAPGLGDATIIETRVGFRPAPAQLRPYLGRISTVDGLFVANGLGAAGLTMGPYVGKLVAELVLGGEPAALAPFDPMRAADATDRPRPTLR
jgi:D-amino-acid dehydrogenase